MSPPRSTGWFSDSQVRYLLVPVLVFMAQASDTGYLADFWHHLARGQVILESGELLDHDIFTFTVANEHFQDANWLSQCHYAWLYSLAGLALVQTVNALVLAVALGLLVHLCRRHSGSLVIAMAVGLGVFLGLWQVLTIRPQSFSLLLFVVFLGILYRSMDRPIVLLWLPPLEALWTNLHGAFPIGCFLIGAFGLAELLRAIRLRRWTPRLTALSLTLVGALVATLANPYGWRIYEYVGVTSQRAQSRGIDEWLPPSFDQWIGLAFFVSLGLLAIVMFAAWKLRNHRPNLEEACLLICFLPLAATSIRMDAWWLLVIALPLGRALAALFPQARDGSAPRSLGATITVAVLCLLAVFSVPWLAPLNPLLRWKNQERTETHLEAVHRHLTTEFTGGRVFTRLEWGEYLGWRGRPDFPVFMDGRIEIYPDLIWQAYSDITQGRDNWETLLDDYRVDIVVLDMDLHGRLGLFDKVRATPGWRETFREGDAVVFVRLGHDASLVSPRQK